ncbi:Uncharacterised protein [Mycobacteroides abscessus subsp. bolletii]|uniref:hypothetical protein n=1 Tax=Mycobacteroides abscessus TaxID=36809 RepID=UPI0009D4529F|nr:hypothetical protein [Mycobacteroides abscessus]SKV07800.1 Uncharacterised protein [Mycobacteroides abscessus subsp. bolletii]
MYNQAAPLLRTPGHRIIERAALKGTVGGDVGMQRLFEPAMLLSLVSSPHTLYEMASVAKDIPFIGNFNQWLPASATIAAAYRALVSRNDSRARDVELWLSLPENGGMPGPPVIHQAMTNRLSGLLVNQIRSDTYRPPLTLPQFSYVIAKLRELSVMWAFGGSTSWPRTRIDTATEAIKYQVSDFIAAEQHPSDGGIR